MNANRRSQERKQPERAVFCKLGNEESSLVLDLSEDGLRFESLTPIEEKDLLQLRLSVDVGTAIEATGKLAWIDSAKRTGGLRFLDLSAPAREQIRAWLSETSLASTPSSGKDWLASPQKRDKQTDNDAATEKPVILEETRVPSRQLVPLERYREQTRLQFLRGVLVGFGICVVVMIPIFLRYAGGTRPGSPAPTTASANRAAQSSGEQTRSSVAQPLSPGASISEPAVAKPLARPQRAKVEEPLGANAGVATAPAASKAHSSLEQVQNSKNVSATAQQLWSALQAGNINAAVALADLYTRGEGVPVNCQQARVLLLAAAEKNNSEASKKLQALNKGGCHAKKE